MSSYRVKTGRDQALVDLTELSPQPDPGPGIQATRRATSLTGAVVDEAKFVEFHWGALDDASAYSTLLALFGLSASTAYADVTVYVRNEVYSFVRMNGTAVRPRVEQDVTWGDRQSRPLNLTILVRDLEAAS